MSKTLVVIRHAKSSWEYGPISDLDRPLRSIGISNTILVSSKLKELDVKPDLIISSPANRALHTAMITARELQYPVDKVRIDQKMYTESEDEILDIVKHCDDSVHTLYIFGHNPGFTFLPNKFLKRQNENVPTSGAIILLFETDSWKNIMKKNLKHEVCLFPKLLD